MLAMAQERNLDAQHPAIVADSIFGTSPYTSAGRLLSTIGSHAKSAFEAAQNSAIAARNAYHRSK